MATHNIAVIGSLNVDFITRTSRLPSAGETLSATSFDIGLGGKGANQAVACARLADQNVQVSMVGQVGDDSFGLDSVVSLEREGIDVSGVRQQEGQKTGVANIIVEEATGENRILLAPNANFAFAAEKDDGWELVPEQAELTVFQLEMPLSVVLYNIKKAKKAGRHVLFNPAPALPLPDSIYQHIDTLILNETESVLVAGESASNRSPAQLAQDFLAKGVRDAVIITLGGKGLVYATASGVSGSVPAREVQVVDTTAAGDTFVGGYAVQRVKHLKSGFDYNAALQFATMAASKTVEKKGAMGAIPRLAELPLS